MYRLTVNKYRVGNVISLDVIYHPLIMQVSSQSSRVDNIDFFVKSKWSS